MDRNINAIIAEAVKRRASDIHICCDCPVKLRIDGSLVDYDEHILTPEDCESYAREISPRFEQIAGIGEQDLSVSFGRDVRCRVNIYRERGTCAVAMRLLNNRIPAFEELGLPSVVNELIRLKKGLVLVTGQTGSGKSTTLAYMINEINKNQCRHIITFEDPVEYIHLPQKSVINQREIGVDTRSFKDGLNSVLREDPDVIMIGELRTLDEIEAALTVAETGHLVLASLHTNSAAETVDRIVDVFPPQQQNQVRLQLSMTLSAVICQQLLPHVCGKGRVLATEVMMMNGAVSNLIRESKTPQIENAIATSGDIGSHLMDNDLITHYKKCRISREEAIRAARNVEYVQRSVR